MLRARTADTVLNARFPAQEVRSYIDSSRDHAVQRMFDRIAARYDLLNRVISFGLDTQWRKKLILELPLHRDQFILDLGTGTGDLSFAAAKRGRGNERIMGLDSSLAMLKLARSKRLAARYGDKCAFVQGSALFVPFKNGVFDGTMTAFLLRNVSDLPMFFAESFRVLKPGGKMVSLDMFPLPRSWFSGLYSIYFYRIVPYIGRFLARDRAAYLYLAESVQTFLPPEAIGALIERAGFRRVIIHKFLHGAVCMHVAEKPPVGSTGA